MVCKERLRKLRIQAGLSQAKLARMADLDRTTVSNAENGKDVQELTVSKMLNALNEELKLEVSVEDVTKEEDVES